MLSKFDDHPCFSPQAARSHARVHLPVAPKCNVQCNFCNRSYDCVNESRPGVTSTVLKPHQALYYLKEVMAKRPMNVVGIAGPGDPFANASETMQTLELVRAAYPDVHLCVATNGLEIGPYITELARLKVSHVTLTISAVDPAVGGQIYAWVRKGPRVYRGAEAGAVMLEAQLAALDKLKAAGIAVKVNTILIPGINDAQVAEIASLVSARGADVMNVLPLMPVKGSNFAGIQAPGCEQVDNLRAELGGIIPQVSHCRRCRADAVGLLEEAFSQQTVDSLKRAALQPLRPGQTRVAVASREGLLVNAHLGEAREFLIYEPADGGYRYLESRSAPAAGSGPRRWLELSETLSDCAQVLVNAVGPSPRAVLETEGLQVEEIEGLIEDALKLLAAGQDLKAMRVRALKVCNGAGGGC